MKFIISEKKKKEMAEAIKRMRAERNKLYDVSAMIDEYDKLDASSEKYAKLIDFYLQYGSGRYGRTREEVVEYINNLNNEEKEKYKKYKTTVSVSKYQIEGKFDVLVEDVLEKNPNIYDELQLDDPDFPKITGKLFSDFCFDIVTNYGRYLFNGMLVNNGYDDSAKKPEFVLWSSKGGAINAKWDYFVENGRIPKNTPPPQTAWCDEHALMAFNVEFLNSLLVKEYYIGNSVKNAKRGSKYKSNGGKFPDCWWVVEYIIIHEVLHYKQGDFYNCYIFSSLIDNLRPNSKPPFHASKFGQTVANITQDLINNWLISEKLGLPILTSVYVSTEINSLRLREISFETGEPPLIAGMRIVMNDLIELNRMDKDALNNLLVRQQDQHYNDRIDETGQGGQGGQGGGQGVDDDRNEDKKDDKQRGQGKSGGQSDSIDESPNGISDDEFSDIEKAIDDLSKKKPDFKGGTKNEFGQEKSARQQQKPESKKKVIDDALNKMSKKSKDNSKDNGKDSGKSSSKFNTDVSDDIVGNNTGSWEDKMSSEVEETEFNPDTTSESNTPDYSDSKIEDLEKLLDSAWDVSNNILDRMEENLNKIASNEDKGYLSDEELAKREEIRKSVKAEAKGSQGISFKDIVKQNLKSALPWRVIINDFFIKNKTSQETYAKMSVTTIATIQSKGDMVAIDPGVIKEKNKKKVRVVFCFDVSSSVLSKLGNANSNLWNYVKKYKNIIDECWLVRFSSDDNYDIHIFTDMKTLKGHKLTPSGKRKVMQAGASNTGEFNFTDTDIYPRAKPFSAIITGESGSSDEASSVPIGGTDFTYKILNILEALYRRQCGILFFTDSDCADGQNLKSMKQMLFKTFGAPPRRNSIGVCMATTGDYVKMVTALGTDMASNGAWRMTYFTNDAFENSNERFEQ